MIDEEDREVISTRWDNQTSAGGLPRHEKGRKNGSPPKQPALWALRKDLGPASPVFGQLPRGFVQAIVPHLECLASEVLHVCSGSLGPEVGGVRIDIMSRARPDIRADARALPIRSASCRAVLLDPPYSVEYAERLYGCDYPRPSHLLREAARVVRPCGRIGFVHYLVPFPPPGCKLVGVYGLSVGVGYRMRAFTVFEREQDALPGVA